MTTLLLSWANQTRFQKNSPLAYFAFILRSTYKFLKMQPLPCTQQVPHLHTWENNLLQEGENFAQHGGFPAELEKAVWPYRLKSLTTSLITLSEWQPFLPQRAPPQPQHASPSSAAGGPSPVLLPPTVWASNCIRQVFPNPTQWLLTDSAPAHGDQPPHHSGPQGSPKDPAY